MKKILALLTMIFTLAFSSMCFAADGGDLNKEQKVVDKLVAAFGATPTPYAELAPSYSAGIKEKLDEKAMTELQKQAKEKLGTVKEYKFISFTRYGQADVLIYLAKFSKQEIVRMEFAFDKTAKLNNFAFAPLEKKEAPAEQK